MQDLEVDIDPNSPKVYSVIIDGKKYIIEQEEPPD